MGKRTQETTIGAADKLIHPVNDRYTMTNSQHAYEVRPRKDHRGVDLISDALPFGPPVVR